MAGMPLSLDGVPLPKSVEEMSMNGDEPPPEFHAKDDSFGCIGSSDLSATFSVPVIDLGLLPSSKDELGKLRLALCSGGCFQVLYMLSSKIIEISFHLTLMNIKSHFPLEIVLCFRLLAMGFPSHF